MEILKIIAAAVFAIAGLVCWVILLLDAFQDEIWKGILGLLCGLYLVYYGVFEFDHENKWIIVLLCLGGTSIAAGLMSL